MNRFWNKINKTDTCWLWTAGKRNGYGQFKINGKLLSAHRVSWELHNGPIPKGLCVLHKCDTPACVNPKHLFLGTMKDNTQDMMNKKRERHPNGENHYDSKLLEKEVLEIRNKYIPRIYTIPILAKEFNVTIRTIWLIIKRKTWKHI